MQNFRIPLCVAMIFKFNLLKTFMYSEGPKQYHFNYTVLGTHTQVLKDMERKHLAAHNCPQNVWDMLVLVFV